MQVAFEHSTRDRDAAPDYDAFLKVDTQLEALLATIPPWLRDDGDATGLPACYQVCGFSLEGVGILADCLTVICRSCGVPLSSRHSIRFYRSIDRFWQNATKVRSTVGVVESRQLKLQTSLAAYNFSRRRVVIAARVILREGARIRDNRLWTVLVRFGPSVTGRKL